MDLRFQVIYLNSVILDSDISKSERHVAKPLSQREMKNDTNNHNHNRYTRNGFAR